MARRDQDASGFRSMPMHDQDATGFRSVPAHDQDASGFRGAPEEGRALRPRPHGPASAT